MSLKYKIALLITLTSLFSFAEEAQENNSDNSTTNATSTAEIPESPDAARPIDNQKNYFGVTLGATDSTGFGLGSRLYYGRRLADQFVLGFAVGGHRGDMDSDGTGTSSTGQFYKNHTGFSSSTAEIDATFFFRDFGYKRFGFLIRTGAGIEWGSVSGYFKRFDDDPGTFHFGDGLRLQETGPTTDMSFTRNFVSIEPAYQFMWAPKGGNHVGGHTLELALSLAMANSQPSISYLRPDGRLIDVIAPRLTSAFNVSYIMVF